VVVVVVVGSTIGGSLEGNCKDSDCFVPTPGLIQNKGYPVETHEVATADGYVLTVHRIPRQGKPVVFLQHGLEDASHGWVMNFPTTSLGFLMYDNEFDVWLGNSRGNVYSQGHVTYNSSQEKFWEFSFDEMARYDLPVQINYVLNLTGATKLVYVGHSQGTLQAFISFSIDKQLASRVALFIALAPVAFVGHVKSKLLLPLAKLTDEQIYLLEGRLGFPSNVHESNQRLGSLCSQLPKVCQEFFCGLFGCDASNWNASRYGVVASHNPAGTSVKNLVHYAQMVRTNKYCMYDYGILGNERHYNQSVPPAYHLSNLQVPTALFYGGHDFIADPEDVQIILQQVPKSTIIYNQMFPNYSHNDFSWGMNAHLLLYPTVISLTKKYSPQ